MADAASLAASFQTEWTYETAKQKKDRLRFEALFEALAGSRPAMYARRRKQLSTAAPAKYLAASLKPRKKPKELPPPLPRRLKELIKLQGSDGTWRPSATLEVLLGVPLGQAERAAARARARAQAAAEAEAAARGRRRSVLEHRDEFGWGVLPEPAAHLNTVEWRWTTALAVAFLQRFPDKFDHVADAVEVAKDWLPSTQVLDAARQSLPPIPLPGATVLPSGSVDAGPFVAKLDLAAIRRGDWRATVQGVYDKEGFAGFTVDSGVTRPGLCDDADDAVVAASLRELRAANTAAKAAKLRAQKQRAEAEAARKAAAERGLPTPPSNLSSPSRSPSPSPPRSPSRGSSPSRPPTAPSDGGDGSLTRPTTAGSATTDTSRRSRASGGSGASDAGGDGAGRGLERLAQDITKEMEFGLLDLGRLKRRRRVNDRRQVREETAHMTAKAQEAAPGGRLAPEESALIAAATARREAELAAESRSVYIRALRHNRRLARRQKAHDDQLQLQWRRVARGQELPFTVGERVMVAWRRSSRLGKAYPRNALHPARVVFVHPTSATGGSSDLADARVDVQFEDSMGEVERWIARRYIVRAGDSDKAIPPSVATHGHVVPPPELPLQAPAPVPAAIVAAHTTAFGELGQSGQLDGFAFTTDSTGTGASTGLRGGIGSPQSPPAGVGPLDTGTWTAAWSSAEALADEQAHVQQPQPQAQAQAPTATAGATDTRASSHDQVPRRRKQGRAPLRAVRVLKSPDAASLPQPERGRPYLVPSDTAPLMASPDISERRFFELRAEPRAHASRAQVLQGAWLTDPLLGLEAPGAATASGTVNGAAADTGGGAARGADRGRRLVSTSTTPATPTHTVARPHVSVTALGSPVTAASADTVMVPGARAGGRQRPLSRGSSRRSAPYLVTPTGQRGRSDSARSLGTSRPATAATALTGGTSGTRDTRDTRGSLASGVPSVASETHVLTAEELASRPHADWDPRHSLPSGLMWRDDKSALMADGLRRAGARAGEGAGASRKAGARDAARAALNGAMATAPAGPVFARLDKERDARALEAVLAHEAAVVRLRMAATRGAAAFRKARTNAQQQSAFDAVTAGIRTARQAAVRLVAAVTAWEAEQALATGSRRAAQGLGGGGAGGGNGVGDDSGYIAFTWHGQAVLPQLAHSLDFLGQVPELRQWYTDAYPWRRNPFGMWVALDDRPATPRGTTRKVVMDGVEMEEEVPALAEASRQEERRLEAFLARLDDTPAWWPTSGPPTAAAVREARLRGGTGGKYAVGAAAGATATMTREEVFAVRAAEKALLAAERAAASQQRRLTKLNALTRGAAGGVPSLSASKP